MRAFALLAITVVMVVHGKVVPLQQIRTVRHFQNAKLFNPPDDIDDIVMTDDKEQNPSGNVSTGGVGCSSGKQEQHRNAHELLLENTHQNESKIYDELRCVCPDAEVFWPCVCDCDEPGGRIDCSEIADVEQLKIKFQTTDFPVKKYSKFISTTSNTPSKKSILVVPSLPENVFDDVSFKQIYMEYGFFKNVHPEAFISSLETLEELSLTRSEYFTIYPQLVEFPNLNKLDLMSNAIELVPVIRPQTSLSRLFLNSNRIKQVMPYAFQNLPSLQNLDLGANQLTSLEENTIYLTSNTPSIYLDHNSIDDIHDRTFSGVNAENQPGLLDLDNNQLTTLKEPVFRKILEIVSLMMLPGGGVRAAENPLDCKTLNWLISSEELQQYVIAPQCIETST